MPSAFPASPAQPELVELLSRDGAFSAAVAARDAHGAAAAALASVRHNWRIFAPALRPSAKGVPGAAPPQQQQQLPAAAAGPAMGMPGAAGGQQQQQHLGDLASPLGLQQRRPTDAGGAAAAAAAAAANAAAFARAGSGIPGAAAARPLERHGSVYKARAPLKLKDFVKLLRRELSAAEEAVPWGLVDSRWRAQRKHWQRRVRQADSVQALAGAAYELHGYLRTDRTAGLFAAGGQWERSLLQVANGAGGQLQLQALWDAMRAALSQWLEGQQQPGSSASLDKAAHARAVRTFNALQEAAAKGPEYLEQVPLDQILSSQSELLALQAVIAREHAALMARLQESGGGAAAGAGGAAAGGGGAAAAEAGGMFSVLGQLSTIKGAEDDDADTDADVGSDATDMDDSE